MKQGANGWTECTVADIAAPTKNALVGGPFGSNLVQRDYVPSGIPVIRGQNMGFGRWVSGEFAFVSEEKAQQLAPNTARPGDLIFTQRGTLGQIAIVSTEPHNRYIISQSQMKLSVDSAKADALFLYYFFTTEEQQDYILRNAIQTGVPHTNLQHLRETPLRLPSLPEQRAIAGVLGALDDKIELNRRMNETLEALAQAEFGRMKDEGGEVKTVGEIAELNSWTLGTNDELDKIEYVEISEVSRGNIANIQVFQRGEEPSRARRRLRHGDTVLSTVRPEHNRRESRTLAALRDALLPKLLSGAVRVKDAEKPVGRRADVATA
jgi:type I restriction enzyme S subunit